MEEMAIMIIESLTNRSKFGRELTVKLREKYDAAQMKGGEGLRLINRFLEEELGERELDKAMKRWNDFQDFKKSKFMCVDLRRHS